MPALHALVNPDGTLDRWGPLVWALCVRLDPQPEDAYQGAWEKILRALPGFDPRGSAALSTWLTRITHNHLVDRYRARRRRGGEVDIAVAVAPGDLDQAALDRMKYRAESALKDLSGE